MFLLTTFPRHFSFLVTFPIEKKIRSLSSCPSPGQIQSDRSFWSNRHEFLGSPGDTPSEEIYKNISIPSYHQRKFLIEFFHPHSKSPLKILQIFCEIFFMIPYGFCKSKGMVGRIREINAFALAVWKHTTHFSSDNILQ